jgi:nitroreductase
MKRAMKLLEAIKGRRSVRSFKQNRIPKRALNQILEAAVLAPSAGNRQPWEFILVTKQELKQELVKVAGGQQFIGEAPTIIVVCANETRSAQRYGSRGRRLYCLQDTAAAIQNIILTAYSFGLGTCWVGAFNENAAKRVLQVPEGIRPVAIIPLGYSVEKPSARSRRLLAEVLHFEAY